MSFVLSWIFAMSLFFGLVVVGFLIGSDDPIKWAIFSIVFYWLLERIVPVVERWQRTRARRRNE